MYLCRTRAGRAGRLIGKGCFLGLGAWVATIGAAELRKRFDESVAPVASALTAAPAGLSAAELAAPIEFRVELEMRALDELRGRIAKGEVISRAEMLARYYPDPAQYDRVADWLAGQGLEVKGAEGPLLAVTARGPVERVGAVLAMRFGRVTGPDGRACTTATSVPSLPAEVGAGAIAIGGLQPDLRMRRAGALITTPGPTYVSPQVVREFYQAGGYDGHGQTIAIMGGGVNPADLEKFWATAGVPQTLANYTVVNVGWTQSTNHADYDASETTCDVEWASAMAPAAKIRVYDTTDPRQFAAAILNDLPTHPGLAQLSMSFGLTEAAKTPALIRAESQYYAALTAEGVTCFVASGDGGSNDDLGTLGSYNPASPLAVYHAASDPCVIGVGGTLLRLTAAGAPAGPETSYAGWVQNGQLQPGFAASGGGVSQIFSRPEWQKGPGVPAGTMRCVPDVSAVWTSSQYEMFAVYAGQPVGFGGTSLSSPVWGGLCALLNQARADRGLAPVGLLGPKIYPLAGTAAFNDVVEGTNGAYTAGVGYDLCSGLGTPNIAVLAQAMVSSPVTTKAALAVVTASPATQSVAPGATVTLSVTATGGKAYRWMRLDPADQNWGELINTAPWVLLDDGGAYTGTHTATLTIANAPASLNGTMYLCQVINDSGIALSLPAIVAVDAALPAMAPKVAVPPGFVNAFVGGQATLSIGVVGTGPFTYQWYDHDNVAIPGETSASLTFKNLKPSDSGSYFIRVQGAGGSITWSGAVSVITNPTLDSPALAAATLNQPFSFTVSATNYDHEANATHFTSEFAAMGLPPGLALHGATGVISGTPTQTGVFDVVLTATNQVGADTTHLTLTVSEPGAPKIIAQPEITAARDGGAVVPRLQLRVVASGGGLNYRWRRDGVPLAADYHYSGESSDTLVLTRNGENYLGSYSVLVSNSAGSVISEAVVVEDKKSPLFVVQPPHRQSAVAGAPVWVSAFAVAYARDQLPKVTYQWKRNGVDLPGATDPGLYFPAIGSDQAGTYTVVATSADGSTASTAAVIDVTSQAQLANISTRSPVGLDADVQIAGFVIAGATPRRILIRAAGPALGALGVSGALPDPTIELHDALHGNVVIATNDNWSADSAAVAAIEQAAAATGALPWVRGTKDAAILTTLNPGIYSAVVRDAAGASGVALTEVYDADLALGGSRVANISTRARVKSGDGVMIAGFVVTGSQPRTVLVRAGGPALAQAGLNDPLTDPKLELHDALAGNAVIATNDDWSADAATRARIEAAASTTGAFGWPRGTKDAALIITLKPGVYSAVVSGGETKSGLAIVEVYDVP